MKNLATINDLNFGYHKNIEFLGGIHLSLQAGRIYGLAGKRDAGKTTLLKLLCGLLFPSSGNVEVMGYEARSRHTKMLANTFFLPDNVFKSSLSIKHFVKTYMPFYPKFSIGKFEGNLNDFSINIDTKDISSLSIGQQKKMMIAFALATNAKLILLDGPTNGLDIPSKIQLQRMLKGSQTDSNCIVIATNQPCDLDNMINTLIVLNNRQIVFHQNMQTISEKLIFSFDDSKTTTSETIFVKEAKGGFQKITKNKNSERTKPNIELLVDAIVADTTAISEIFST